MDANEAIVRKMDDLAKEKRYDELVELFANDVEGWSPAYHIHSREELLSVIKLQNDAAENIDTTLNISVCGEKVFSEGAWSGTYPALGDKRLTLKSLSVFEIEGGLIKRFRQYWDHGAAMRDLGMA